MNTRHTITTLFAGALALGAVLLAFFWFACRVDVGPDECLIVVKKSGAPLAAGQVIATAPDQRGVQLEAFGPGRYFFNPVTWETETAPLTTISAGDPATWLEVFEAGQPDYSVPTIKGKWPEVGVITSFVGKDWTGATEVVDDGYRGLQRRVLTPGTYRLNPKAYEVRRVPAHVVPLGCVGVVTSQIGEEAEFSEVVAASITPEGEVVEGVRSRVQQLAEEGQRGVMSNVLPPGLYYINPWVYKVKNVQVGYNQISQFRAEDAPDEITFPSADGFTIAVEVTVVWGREPNHTPELIYRLGEVSRIKEIILGQIRSICRNVGSQYNSIDFIEGEKREQYQRAVTETLKEVCRQQNIEILIALIQNIEVRGGSDIIEGPNLKETIQLGYIAKEEKLTKEKQQETQVVAAELRGKEQAIAREARQVSEETSVIVAQIQAEGRKKAEEINAQRDYEVAVIERDIAKLQAERTLVLGTAEAEVQRMKRQAEADGKRMFVEAFGSGRAYNLYTFAQNFAPDSIRLIFAGEGTFWTDLTKLQDVAAMELLHSQASEPQPAPQQEQ